MRIKRYFAKNIREAIRKVRQEQGPDAVILSNRNVEGGVELVAAVDFEEVLFCDDALLVNNTQAAAPQQQPQPTQPVNPAAAKTQPSKTYAPTPSANAPFNKAGRTTNHGKAEAKQVSKPAGKQNSNRGAKDLALAEMRREMKNMRGMLEQQLNGVMWGDTLRRNPHQAKLLHKLLRLELSPKLCQQIIGDLAKAGRPDYTLRSALGVLAHKLPVTDDDILINGGVVALLGPTGVGKTTTIAKLAARFAVRHGSRTVALITTDNYRVGAHEQLRAYAKILDIPLRVATNRPDLRSAIKDYSDRKLVLIDTAGMSQRDIRLSEQFALIKSGSSMIKPYIVLSATTRLPGLMETAKAFSKLSPKGCIITKIDEVDNLGGILNILIKHQLPAAYISDGQRVPEDLYVARAHNLISRSVALVQNASRDMDYGAMPLAVAFN